MLEDAKKTGVLSQETLMQTPGYDVAALKAKKGPVVMIECAENIPCNPCETVCPHGAILVGDKITNLPSVDVEKCTGCGLCVAVCPGLAIFLLDLGYKENFAAVTFAYEYLPVPDKGAVVPAVDREGNFICDAVVEKVVSVKGFDMTKVMTISVLAEFALVVRGIKRTVEE
jgi:Fe-S-cluster-containing hydrogenase component 2